MASSIEDEFRAKLAQAPEVPLAGLNPTAPDGENPERGSEGGGEINWSSSEKADINQMIGRARYKERLRQLKAQRGGKARHEARITKLTKGASEHGPRDGTGGHDHSACGEGCSHDHPDAPLDSNGADVVEGTKAAKGQVAPALAPKDGLGVNAPTKAKYKRAQKKKRQLAKKKEAERAKKAEEVDQRVFEVSGQGTEHEKVRFHLDD